jgi:hypothetical protein
VLFVSGYSEAMPASPAAPGTRAFLAKPFTIAAVKAAIADLVTPGVGPR